MQGEYHFTKQERLVWGRPCANAVAEEVERAGWSRAFVVTNRSLVSSKTLQDIVAALGRKYAGIYGEVVAHSPREAVLDGSAAARAANADIIVALGGGSVIDAVKVMLSCLWGGLTTWEDLDRLASTAPMPVAHASVRMIAVPTTLSAAEYTSLAGITDRKRKTKDIYRHPSYAPVVVILDPEATMATPGWLMLSSGIRSVDHSVEAWLSRAPTPISDAFAREALRRLPVALRALAVNPLDLAARLECQISSFLAISAPLSGAPVGASHAIGRVLGGAFNVSHGQTSCVLLPAVVEWNSLADNGRQQDIPQLMGAAPNLSASEAIASLIDDLKEPRRLRDIGIKKSDFALIADRSMTMLSFVETSGNQRTISSSDQVKEILELAF